MNLNQHIPNEQKRARPLSTQKQLLCENEAQE